MKLFVIVGYVDTYEDHIENIYAVATNPVDRDRLVKVVKKCYPTSNIGVGDELITP